MKFSIILLISFFLHSCSSINNNEKIIIKNNATHYSYEIKTISKKIKNGKIQCNKYVELDENTDKISYYGPDLNQLIAYLKNTEIHKIKSPILQKNIFYILNIKFNSANKESVFKYIIDDLLNYYNLKEEVKCLDEKAYNLSIKNRNKLIEYKDTISINGYYKITNNNIEIVSLNFKELTDAINNYFKTKEIMTSNSNIIDKYSFNINSIDDFNSIKQILINKYGIITQDSIIKNNYYEFSIKSP